MKKKEYIERYGKEAYKKQMLQNDGRLKVANCEKGRKGGKYYTKHLKYEHT